MFHTISQWYQRNFTDPQAVLLTLIVVFGFAIILLLGDMLAPVFAAVVIAYLLESPVQLMKRQGVLRHNAVRWIFILFLTILFFLVFGLIPLLLSQVTQFLAEFPTYIGVAQQLILDLQDKLHFIPANDIKNLGEAIKSEIAGLGQIIVTLSLASIPGLISAMIYLVLVPLLVFFFMKDKNIIINWFSNYMPSQHALVHTVWSELDIQLGRYIKGKFWEFLILGISCYLLFAFLGLKYSILLAMTVGLSVIIPYIGFVIVTIPVSIIAYFQFGAGSELYALLIIYMIINALDGYVLVPVLFAEVVNLHPIAIIVSILLFGGLWGFWGIFFAIPLATLVNAILRAWPRNDTEQIELKQPQVSDSTAD